MRKVFIIAEAGVNHNGSMELAKKLIDVASYCGVDAVKFQTFKAENLLSKNSPKADYQTTNCDKDESAFDMIKKLELTTDNHKELIHYCKEKNIQFMSSAFDIDSINELINLGIDIFKIPSGEITNYPYLKKIGSLNKKVILSTGMSTMSEVEEAIKVLKECNSQDITLLHCNTEYPTPMNDVNLKAMNTMKEKFDLEIGYSDHTSGVEVAVAAVALGATIIEKHFTLDKNLKGPDHKASLDPNELYTLVSSIRNIEKALGDGVKKPSDSELKNIDIVRKSIVASKPIKEGEVFTENNITTKRPGNGINPMNWNEILGQKAIKNFDEDEMIII